MRLRNAIIILTPLLALCLVLFVDLVPGQPAVTRTAAVALLMAVWWISGVVPLGATALLPIVLFPLAGVLSAGDVARQYFNDTIFLFLGGFLVALAMQCWDLHKRIALRILLIFGVRPRALLFGFMLPTFLLSMWISNTATTMMMVPIALSVVMRLEERADGADFSRYGISLLLAVAYSASIGGTATLIGTPPNLAFRRITEILFPAAPEITFAQWLLFAFPLALLLLLVLWVLFAFRAPARSGDLHAETGMIRTQYDAMGKMTYEQAVVMVVFVTLGVLWMTRTGFTMGAIDIPGWGNFFANPELIKDGTVAIGMALLLFLIPARDQNVRLLDWETAKQLPWDIILLYGGGFALAAGFVSSGLSEFLGGKLVALAAVPPTVMILGLTASMSLLTELTSNTATTEMMLPILAALAVKIDIHPFLLMIPATLACSYAFLLPVATPPNAIIFGTGRVRVMDMIRAGFLLNVVAVALITAAIFLWAVPVLGITLDGAPAWAVIVDSVSE